VREPARSHARSLGDHEFTRISRGAIARFGRQRRRIAFDETERRSAERHARASDARRAYGFSNRDAFVRALDRASVTIDFLYGAAIVMTTRE